VPRFALVNTLTLPLVVTVLVTAGCSSSGTNTSTSSSSSSATPAASAAPRVTATIKVDKAPLGVAVDPTTHTVYTANSGDDTVSVIQR
jgi:DNA-binding beta-propeller fold protein YncE